MKRRGWGGGEGSKAGGNNPSKLWIRTERDGALAGGGGGGEEGGKRFYGKDAIAADCD